MNSTDMRDLVTAITTDDMDEAEAIIVLYGPSITNTEIELIFRTARQAGNYPTVMNLIIDNTGKLV